MRPFNQLTPRGQATCLRALAINALRDYNLDVRRISLLSNSFNGIFRVDTADGEKYALRIGLPWVHMPDETDAEMHWLAALAAETDIAVPRPIATRAGALLTMAEAPRVPQKRQVSIFTWAPGRNLAEVLSPATVERQGALMARLHEHARGYVPPNTIPIAVWDTVFYFFSDGFALFDDAYREFMPPDRRAVYAEAIQRVQGELDAMFTDRRSAHLLHGDLHQANVKVHRERLIPIDFEDLTIGFPIQDIAISMFYYQRRDDYPALLDAFRRGYASLLPWPEQRPGQLDILIAGRALMMANHFIQHGADKERVAARMEERLRIESQEVV